MFRRRPHARRALRIAEWKLKRIHALKTPAPDLEPVRRAVRALVDGLAGVPLDEEVAHALDESVRGKVAELHGDLHKRHQLVTSALDRLDAYVGGIVARLEQLAEDERTRLAEFRGVSTHIWDRVVEPDLPHVDPIR